MGREVKRVPDDFDHPMNEIWTGFKMPADVCLPTCTDCNGRGSTAAAEWVGQIVHLLLMVDSDLDAQERGRPLHPWLAALPLAPALRPSADIAQLGEGLAGRRDSIFGHDAVDRWRATAAVVKAAGLPETWGICSACSGNGHAGTAEQFEAYENWTSTEPPRGEGWQLWETVSEGSPISPVFATAEELATWMTQNRCTVDGPMSSYEAALRFVQAGWAPSFMSSPETGLVSGTEWVGGEVR